MTMVCISGSNWRKNVLLSKVCQRAFVGWVTASVTDLDCASTKWFVRAN